MRKKCAKPFSGVPRLWQTCCKIMYKQSRRMQLDFMVFEFFLHWYEITTNKSMRLYYSVYSFVASDENTVSYCIRWLNFGHIFGCFLMSVQWLLLSCFFEQIDVRVNVLTEIFSVWPNVFVQQCDSCSDHQLPEVSCGARSSAHCIFHVFCLIFMI